jgi:hypothetical protein
MSLIRLFVTALVGIWGTIRMVFSQIANLEDVEPANAIRGVERMVLRFDKRHIHSAMSYFLDAGSPFLDRIVQECEMDGVLACLIRKGLESLNIPLGCDFSDAVYSFLSHTILVSDIEFASDSHH